MFAIFAVGKFEYTYRAAYRTVIHKHAQSYIVIPDKRPASVVFTTQFFYVKPLDFNGKFIRHIIAVLFQSSWKTNHGRFDPDRCGRLRL